MIIDSRRSLAIFVFLAPLCGFYETYHTKLIGDAFREVPKAGLYAHSGEAEKASKAVDAAENTETDQYKHSMRPAMVTLAIAQRRYRTYREYHMAAAVNAALENDPFEAGRNLGRILHAEQDAKHQWCSCASVSNGRASAQPCSESPRGCPISGDGHHAILNCSVSLPEPGYKSNFQLRTDGGPIPFLGPPLPEQIAAAFDRSKDVLNEFVKRVESKRPQP